MNSLLRHRDDKDEGFTLIELMVVVLIIAILLAIAIPTFLGAQNKAKDRSAQSSVRNSLTAAKTLYADTGTYTDSGDAALTAIEPAFTFVAADVDSTGPKVVSVEATAGTWTGAVMSDTGTCYYVQDSILQPDAAGTLFAKTAEATTCSAGDTVTFSATGWD